MREKLIDIIRSSGLTRVENELISLIKESIRIKAVPKAENKIKIGNSKLGGLPDLPEKTEWYRWDGKPLSFIFQANLTELTQYDTEKIFPDHGMLYFFYDADDQPWGFKEDLGRWQVIYYDGEIENLKRAKPPEDLSPEVIFDPCEAEFETELTVPAWDNLALEDFNLDEKETDLYFELIEKVIDLNNTDDVSHRMLGYPDQIQGDMQLECELAMNVMDYDDLKKLSKAKTAKFEAEAQKWKLLLQVDSWEETGMMWGDIGRIYFWIREKDLKEINFENSWLILQCS